MIFITEGDKGLNTPFCLRNELSCVISELLTRIRPSPRIGSSNNLLLMAWLRSSTSTGTWILCTISCRHSDTCGVVVVGFLARLQAGRLSQAEPGNKWCVTAQRRPNGVSSIIMFLWCLYVTVQRAVCAYHVRKDARDCHVAMSEISWPNKSSLCHSCPAARRRSAHDGFYDGGEYR